MEGMIVSLNLKSCEKKEKSTFELVIEADGEEFNTAMDGAFRKNRNSISVPGFRRGKAPRKIVEKMYGASIFYNDAIDLLAPEVIAFTSRESGLTIVGLPQVKDVDFKEDASGVDFIIIAAVYPEVTIGEYKGLSAVKPPAEVLDSEVDSEIAGMQLRNARVEKADRPAINGDTAVIDYEGFLDGEPFDGGKGENYELVLGSNSFIPGFEEKIHGMTTGEERDLDLVFPESYAEHLAGKPVVFKVKLNELREKILPELDDEFAKDVSEFDTLDEYKASIMENIQKVRDAEAESAFENALLQKLALTVEADIPDAMVDENLSNAMQNFSNQMASYGMDPAMYLRMINKTPEEFREGMRSQSEIQVKVTLALRKIAELECIEVSAEDIEKEYAVEAERYGAELDEIKEQISEEDVTLNIKMQRAVKIVTDNAIAEDPPPEDDEASDGESGGGDEADGSAPVDEDGTTEGAPPDDDIADAGAPAGDAAEPDGSSSDNVKKTPAKKPAAKKKAVKESADENADEPGAGAEADATDAGAGAEADAADAGAGAETGAADKPKAKKTSAKKTKQGDESK